MSKRKGDAQVKVEDVTKREKSRKQTHGTDAAAALAVKPEVGVKEEKKAKKEFVKEEFDRSRNCPYLDTIDRKVLDFDFEKLCSISLSNLNVYACLVCGKYFQGRGKNSHAYFHSLEQDHHVFINLQTEKIYCLPDNYEVIDSSLEDIRFNLHPKFTPTQARKLGTNTKYTHALDGTDYLPGVIGLNNIKNTDWLNAVVQALARVPTLRNFFLVEQNYSAVASRRTRNGLLVRRFGELMCKIWNPRNFKSQVSPHELLQAVSSASDKKFKIGVRSDPVKFVSWLLNVIHREMGGTHKKNSSVISKTFQGELEVTIKKPILSQEAKSKAGVRNKDDVEMEKEPSADNDDDEEKIKYKTTVRRQPFLYLSLALPPQPLFKDTQDRSLIAQVPLFTLLEKFDGVTEEVLDDGTRKTYRLLKLPKHLMVHYRRFKENNWFMEKNQTLVNFPLFSLDMKPYMVEDEMPPEEEVEKMSIGQLKKLLHKKKIKTDDCVERSDLVQKLEDYYDNLDQHKATRYDLLANVVHDGPAESGAYKTHIHEKATNTWFEIQDLHVTTSETMAQQVALSEAYIQIYELQKPDSA